MVHDLKLIVLYIAILTVLESTFRPPSLIRMHVVELFTILSLIASLKSQCRLLIDSSLYTF